MKNIIAGVLVSLAFFSCSTQNRTASNSTDNRQYLTLMDHLRGRPGLQIHNESFVTVRGLQSANAEQQPLYIIDGGQVGNSYQAANDIVDPNDIASVTVLKDLSSLASYGMRGANGVIIIKTKKK